MTPTKRATISFEPDILKALRLKAAATDLSVSEVVNEAVRLILEEEAQGLLAFTQRLDKQKQKPVKGKAVKPAPRKATAKKAPVRKPVVRKAAARKPVARR